MAYDEKLAARIRLCLGSARLVTEKTMFGGIGFLVKGNLACGVIKQDMIVRLSPEDFDAALKKPHVRVFDMSGRPMKGWVYVALPAVATKRQLQAWVDKGVAFASTLPAK